MTSIYREVLIAARPEPVWDALRDIGAIHRRLAPGFVTNVKLEEGGRVVTFGNGDDPPERLRPGVSGWRGPLPVRVDCRSPAERARPRDRRDDRGRARGHQSTMEQG